MDKIAYITGSHRAWLTMLHECHKQLGMSTLSTLEQMQIERAEAILALRFVCAVHGDNEWEPDLHLADIINKHLGDHLEARED